MQKLFCFLCSVWLLTMTAGAVPSMSRGSVYLAKPGERPSLAAQENGVLREEIPMQCALFFPIEDADRADAFQNLRAIASWTAGGEWISFPRIEYREMFDASGNRSLGYRYVVAVTVDAAGGAGERIAGSIKIASRPSEDRPAVMVMGMLQAEDRPAEETGWISCHTPSLRAEFENQPELLRFRFYDRAEFLIETPGLASCNIGCSVRPFSDIAERFSTATLSFLYWTAEPIFLRAGTLSIEAAPGHFLYEMQGEQYRDLTEYYQEEQRAFVLQTRRLGQYVISDRPLTAENESPLVIENPPTGSSENFSNTM